MHRSAIARSGLFLGIVSLFMAASCGGQSDSLDGAPGDDDLHGDDSSGDPPNDDPSIGAVDPGDTDPESETPTPSSPDAGGPPKDGGAPVAPAKIKSPVPGKVVTYPYGVKNPRYAAGYHTGDDYAAATGLKVVAVRSGKIRWSNDNGGAYGKWIGLDADNGRTYVYCHLSSRSVSAGTTIVAGQTLGKVGATGNVTGPHLHFEDHPLGPFVYAKVRKPAW